MVAEIICVGTELLLGDIVNTNARFLSRELAELGITVDAWLEPRMGGHARELGDRRREQNRGGSHGAEEAKGHTEEEAEANRDMSATVL